MGFLEFLTGSLPPLVKGALEDFCVMMDVSRNMVTSALAGLLDNEILDHGIDAQQAEINRREEALRRAVLEHLTVDPKSELVLAMKLLTVSQEVQPLGTIATAIHELATRVHRPRMGPAIDSLRIIRSRILPQFDGARDSFVEADQELADAVASELRQAYADLTAFMMDLQPVDEVMHAGTAGGMKRVCTHLSLIAGTVTFSFHQVRNAVPIMTN